MNTIIQHTIRQLLDIQKGKLWMGSSYDRKLNAIDNHSVFKRPIENLHSVAEIISHITFWRKQAIVKIKAGTGGKTDDCEENWLSNEQLKEIGWKNLKLEYDKSLSELIELLHTKHDEFLDQKYYDTDFKGDYSYRFLIDGMLHHDIYHLGQLGIIIKYLKEESRS